MRYVRDWTTIMPTSDHSNLNRWRFAYCTVHTPWLRSCEQYNAIKNTYENTNKESLIKILKNTSGGMWDIKATGISTLHEYWQDTPEIFEPQTNWQRFRNNLVSKLKKLGFAKTSFAIEMIHPHEAQCICIDRHMFKAFGWENVDRACSPEQYHYYENWWIDLSNSFGIAPVVSRNLFWDKIQQQPSSMYWAKYL